MAIEGMLATIMDTIGCTDTKTALSIITTFSADQSILRNFKEDLEAKKKLSVKL